MNIVCKINNSIEEIIERKQTDINLLSEKKSEYGKLFYHSDPSDVYSVDVECDGMTFLFLLRDIDGKVLVRDARPSEEAIITVDFDYKARK